MPEIVKIQVDWTGFNGGPGYTNLYFSDTTFGLATQAIANSAAAKVDTFLASMTARFPLAVAAKVNPTAEIINPADGKLQGFMTVTPSNTRQGEGTGTYSGASGACVNWYTGGVVRGRRVRGRMFLVPLIGSSYATNGTLDDTMLTGLRTAVATLSANNTTSWLGVWSRPSAKGATDGNWFGVQSSTVNDKAAILRSRRD